MQPTPLVNNGGEERLRASCANNLKQLGLGFQHYHNLHGKIPFGGDVGPDSKFGTDLGRFDYYNWTYHLLPFIEQESVYVVGQTELAKLQKSPVAAYYCPARRQVRLYQDVAKCDYAANGGRGDNGVLRRNRRGQFRFADLRDGASNTLLAGEARIHRGYRDTPQEGYNSDNEDCYTNGWGDDVIRFAHKSPQPDLARSGDLGSECHRPFGGSHGGVMNALMCDGSVRGVSFSITTKVFRGLAIRNDGQVFDLGSL